MDYVCIHDENDVSIKRLKAQYPGISFLSLEAVRRMKLKGALFLVHLDVDGRVVEARRVLEAAGFEVRKARGTLTSVAAPMSLTATNLDRKGEAYLSWSPVAGSSIFGIEKRKKGETVWQNGDYATASFATIKNIESGTWMEFRVITKATKGITSDWSAVVEVLVS